MMCDACTVHMCVVYMLYTPMVDAVCAHGMCVHAMNVAYPCGVGGMCMCMWHVYVFWELASQC